MMYDVVIIGAGPAGISAGIYAASRGKKVLITEKNTVGGLIGKVSTVTHYAGIMTEETGSSFAKRLKIQAENTGIDIIYEEVTQVELQGSIKKVFTKDGAYDAKKIVLANGTTPRKHPRRSRTYRQRDGNERSKRRKKIYRQKHLRRRRRGRSCKGSSVFIKICETSYDHSF